MSKELGRCPHCAVQVATIQVSRPTVPPRQLGGHRAACGSNADGVQAQPMEWQLVPCGHWVNSEQGGLISTGSTPVQTEAQKQASTQAILDAIDGARNGRQAVTEACKAGVLPESWLEDMGMPLSNKDHAELAERRAEEARDEAMSEDYRHEEAERRIAEAALDQMAEILGVTKERVREFVNPDIPTMDIAVERAALDKIMPKIRKGTGLVPGSLMAKVLTQKKNANNVAIQRLRENMELQALARPRKRKIRRPK